MLLAHRPLHPLRSIPDNLTNCRPKIGGNQCVASRWTGAVAKLAGSANAINATNDAKLRFQTV